MASLIFNPLGQLRMGWDRRRQSNGTPPQTSLIILYKPEDKMPQFKKCPLLRFFTRIWERVDRASYFLSQGKFYSFMHQFHSDLLSSC